MRLNRNQLIAYLKNLNTQINNFYWLNSEDCYLLNDSLKKIRKFANNHGFDERLVFHIDNATEWDQIISHIQTPSLFSQKQIIELHFTTKISTSQQNELTKISEYINKSTGDNNNLCIIIYPFRVESKVLKQKWMNALDNNGVIITIWPLSSTDYPLWLKSECQKYKINFETSQCFEYFCQKTMGNTSIAAQTLFKLKLQDIHCVNYELLNEVLSEHANYNIFDLVDSYLLLNTKQCFKILSVLKKDNTAPLLIVWSLRKELLLLADIIEKAKIDRLDPQQILNSYKLWAAKKSIYSKALTKFNLENIYKSLNKIIEIEKLIKTENNEVFIWQLIEQLLLLNNNISLFVE